ncbi:MAG: thioredoxin family protein [Bacteroidetes bacterium]|nr:MAG: thioredoxin family protein [Bacteroidota bacterium]
MKKLLSTIAILFLLHYATLAQNQFQVFSERPNEKTYKGIISRDVLMADTSFTWLNSAKNFVPEKSALDALRKGKDSIQLLVFMGTWCEDSHDVIPRLYSMTDAAGFSQDRITLIGVDRKKTTLSHLTEAMNIINVPTIIVMKRGKEVGRIVEYGKYGMIDRELGEIVNSINPVSH